jgi:CheY-like chemotaxis protein
MDTDHWLKLLAELTSLLQVIIWPLLVVIAFVYLGSTLKNYINDIRKDKNVSELSTEVGPAGIKLNIKREVEVATNLVLANKNRQPSEVPDAEQIENETEEVFNIVSKVTISETVQEVAGTKALWVDDNPFGNTYERSALEAFGIQFTLSTSTEDALDKVRTNKYNVIISDMGRSPDERAGYTLLSKLQERGVHAPFIIYSGSNRPEYKTEAIRRGSCGATNNPSELFQLVLDAIKNG